MKKLYLFSLLLILTVMLSSLGTTVFAEEGNPVPFSVTEEKDFAEVLAEVENHTFSDGDYALINVTGNAVIPVQNGLILGVSPSVPTVIVGGNLSLPEGTEGNVRCEGDITFRSLTLDVGSLAIRFFAGNGSVRFDNVQFGSGTTAEFFADCPDRTVGTVTKSALTFSSSSYGGPVWAAGAEDGAAVETSFLTVENSTLANVGIRKETAVSNVKKATVLVKGDASAVSQILAAAKAGNQKNESASFDVEVEIAGGTVEAIHTGNGTGKIRNLTNTVSGGTVQKFCGTGSGNADEVLKIDSVTNVLSGGTVNEFYGTGNQVEDGAVSVKELESRFAGTSLAEGKNLHHGTGDAEIENAKVLFTASGYGSGNKGYFYGTARSFSKGGDVSGSLQIVISKTNKFFHTFYMTGAKISGKLDVDLNVGSTTKISLSRLSMLGGAGSVEYDMNYISGFSGELNLICGTVDGNATVTVNQASSASYFRATSEAVIGGDLTVSITKLTKTGATRPLQLASATVNGKVTNRLVDCTISSPVFCATGNSGAYASSNVDYLYAKKGSFSQVENHFTGCTISAPVHCVNGDGCTSVKNYFHSGTFNGKVFGSTNGLGSEEKSVSLENHIENGTVFSETFYGTGGLYHLTGTDSKANNEALNNTVGSALYGNVVTTVNGAVFSGSFYGAAGSVTGNVTNTLTDVNLADAYFGAYTVGGSVSGKVLNRVTRLTMTVPSASNWFNAVSGSKNASMTVGGVETTLDSCAITYYKSLEYCTTLDTNADGKGDGDVINVYRNSTFQGACFSTHNDGARNVVNTVDSCEFTATFYAANGKANGTVRTTVLGDTVVHRGMYAGNTNQNDNVLTFVSGTVYGQLWPHDDNMGSRIPKIVLAGNVNIYATTSLVLSSVEEGSSIVMHDDWENKAVYATVVDPADLEKIQILEKEGGVSGAGSPCTESGVGYIKGANLLEGAMISLSVKEQITLNLWLPAAALNENLSGDEELGIRVSFGKDSLPQKVFTAEDLAKTEITPDGYYKFETETVHAKRFDDAIVIEIQIGNETVVLDAVDGKALTVSNLAEKGYLSCKEYIAAEAKEEDLLSYTLDRNLFAAIYNYGASVTGKTPLEMNDFLKDNAADPKYQRKVTEDILFERTSLLMGSAVGIRFEGTVKNSHQISVTVNGEKTARYTKTVENGKITLDLFISMEWADQELDISISTESGEALRMKTSVKGYAEKVQNQNGKTLALAQLVQAAYDVLNPPEKVGMPKDLFAHVNTAQEDPAADGELNVLYFGGSSLTGFLDELNELLKQGSVPANIYSAYHSGSVFENHWENSQDSSIGFYRLWKYSPGKTTEKITTDTTASFETCISQANWDVIVLHHHHSVAQQESAESALSCLTTDCDRLIQYLKAYYPKTRIVFHQQWANDVGTYNNDTVTNVSHQTLCHESLRAMNLDVIERYDIERSPNGDAWQLVRNHPDYWGSLTRDNHHDGDETGGQFLNACVWYEVLTGRNVLENTWRPTSYTLAANRAEILMNAAHKAVEDAFDWDETNPLHGKKVIFVGNSYTYYGNAVIAENNVQTTDLAVRQNDRGYFYQLCKANGANVNVTNWTYGSHGLADLFHSCTITSKCDKGYDHAADLTDAFYDYVFLQDRSGEEYTVEVLLENVRYAVDFFRSQNPDVKIYFFAQSRLYEWNVQWLPALKELEKMGVTVVEWGALVEDVISGKATVEGSTQSYNRNSFIISQSSSDGYHPNLLSGYITAAMGYSAITGESARGLPYAFCTDPVVEKAFNATTYTSKYYKNGAITNFKEIFSSPSDMLGLQKLMDEYLAAHNYRNYN